MGAHHQGGADGEVVTARRALEGGEPGQRILARQADRLARVGDDERQPLLRDGLGQGIELQRDQLEAPPRHALIQPAHQRLPLMAGHGETAGRQHAYSYRLAQGRLRSGRWLHRLGQGGGDAEPEPQGQQGPQGGR
ncbi:hypothetical protein D3C85_957290 [compost metagenome]